MSVCLIAITFLIDKHIDGKHVNALMNHLFSEDAGTLANILGGLTQVAPAILGIAITVIAIIVEMASNKYSPKVMDLFVNNPINFAIMTLFVVTSVNSMWVAHILTAEFFPIVSIIINGLLVSISLLLVIPYFNHIFNFLHPNNFLTYVKEQTLGLFDDLDTISNASTKMNVIKGNIHDNVDFIGDIAINSAVQGDRAVSQYCTNILKDICIYYLDIKKEIAPAFFHLNSREIEDPDFIDFSEFVITTIQEKNVWFERKILRLMEIIFNLSRENLRTVASGVLLNTMRIGQKGCEVGDQEVIFTVMQHYNTFLRYAINNNDPRTAFNILEHYRNYGEVLIHKYHDEVENVVFYFKYYALEAQKKHVLFILETAAHDICKLIEIAYEKDIPNHLDLLQQFLKLDQPIEESSDHNITQQEMSLIGVRLAQAKLAAFYIGKDRIDLAKIIYEDMKVEPLRRIQTIQEIINMNTREEYWEITGRGINFFYVSPEQRESLVRFFAWFD